MKRKNLNILAVLSVLAVTALLFIQYYWVRNAINLRNEDFLQRTGEAIHETVSKLENIDMYSCLDNEMKRGRSIVKDFSKLQDKNMDTLLTMDESIKIKDTIIDEHGQPERYIVVKGQSLDTLTGLQASHKIVAKDRTNMDIQYDPETGSINVGNKSEMQMRYDKKMKELLTRKAQYVNEMVVKLYRNNLARPIQRRVQLDVVDSLINVSLNMRGVDAAYRYTVVNKNDNPIKYRHQRHPLNYSNNIKKADHKHLLFPNDFVKDKYYVKVKFPERKKYIIGSMWSILITSGVIILAVVALFYFTLILFYRQKHLSQIKSNFIGNMTHELKTPISTISLACEALVDPDVPKNPETTDSFVDTIQKENKRLGVLVENVLQTSLLDRGSFKIEKQLTNLNEIIQRAVSASKIQVENRGGEILLNLTEEDDTFNGDRIHLTNVIHNLLDNANKYSKDSPKVEITTLRKKNTFVIKVKDNGIGMKKEHLNKIFDRLYRIPTGNVHDVKGFGLGLSYVKSIVTKHGGTIQAKSEQGKGTEFIIKFNLTKHE